MKLAVHQFSLKNIPNWTKCGFAPLNNATLLIYHVFNHLWSVTPDGFDSGENVHFSIKDDLFDAGVGGAINATARTTVSGIDVL